MGVWFSQAGNRALPRHAVISLCSLKNVQGKSVSVSWAWLTNIRSPRVNTAPILYCLSAFRGHLLHVDIKEENWKAFSFMSLYWISGKRGRKYSFWLGKKDNNIFCFVHGDIIVFKRINIDNFYALSNVLNLEMFVCKGKDHNQVSFEDNKHRINGSQWLLN